ncbi:hypothetical protein GJ744_009271 [Endocarpon pusillum]|uniref:rRNA methyltransferase 1, mitochondrial n=1 Tax=Endocarpon pusillum TaxID=364733 RepID=A0A8H7AG96_9EURO|nr:hypothetical protein GJ744_009271 [Endocarpon pusillum]
MLSIATARGVRGTKCFSNSPPPVKRLASLTGAIQRGTRKARDVGERMERYNNRINSNPNGGFQRETARGPSRAVPFEQQFAGRSLAEQRRFQQGGEGRERHEEKPRYPRRDSHGVAWDQPAERFSRAKGDRSSLPRQPPTQDSFSRAAYRDKNASRNSNQDLDKVHGYRRAPDDFSERAGERRSFSRRPSVSESSLEVDYRDQNRSRNLNKVNGEDAEDRSLSKRPFIGEQSRPSFSRRSNAPQDSSGMSDRNHDQPSYPKKASTGISDLKSSLREALERHAPKHLSGQPLSRNAERYVSEHAGQESMSANRHVTVPLSIPRSSAASEFLYGTSAVKAALQSGTRKLFKLYIQQEANGTEQREGDNEVLQLARKRGLVVKRLGAHADDSRLLSKMAQGRPHNGYVLEASRLPNTPARALDTVEKPGDGFTFTPDHQSEEEIAVNGTSCKILGSNGRYPFVLLLDSILDPGNLGAIIRSAAFFGVDAIALIDYNLAPFSPVTLKASSGAAEYMHYLRIKNDINFVKRSQSNGWKFFAAVAPRSASASRGGPSVFQIQEAEEALLKGPCVLMFGGEGDGLRPRLQKVSDGIVGIEGAVGAKTGSGLDSLNVSVAAALMMQVFVKGSTTKARTENSEGEVSREDELLF